MIFTIIENSGMQKYILDVFHNHIDCGLEIGCFATYKSKISKIENIPEVDISEITKSEYNTVLVAVKSNSRLQRILIYLYERNIKNIYVIKLYTLDKKLDFLTDEGIDERYVHHLTTQDTKPYLGHLETHVCDHCNLNCKACNNFSPFVREAKCADSVCFERDMQTLSGLYSNIGRFFLLGGEPLLEPELCCEMIKIFRHYFPDAELRVLTNALLIPQMTEAFWECLRENQVIVHISVYPPVIPKLSNIEAVLQENQIEYLLARKVGKFVKHWTLYPFEDDIYNNERCGSAGCHYLREGMLSKCPEGILMGNMAWALDCVPEELQAQQNIKLTEDADPWEVIRMLESPIDLCKKCTYRRLEAVPWGQTGTSIEVSDWLLENRLEYENRVLSEKIGALTKEREAMTLELQDVREQVTKAESKIAKLQEKVAEKENELKNRLAELSDKEGKLTKSQAELQKAKEDIHKWNMKWTQTDHELQEKNEQLDWIGFEYERILHSVSYRIGRILTWLPRKMRRIIKGLFGIV